MACVINGLRNPTSNNWPGCDSIITYILDVLPILSRPVKKWLIDNSWLTSWWTLIDIRSYYHLVTSIWACSAQMVPEGVFKSKFCSQPSNEIIPIELIICQYFGNWSPYFGNILFRFFSIGFTNWPPATVPTV